VEFRNYLGIYLRKDRATVVCLAMQGRDRKVIDSFSVSVEDEEEPSPQLLADRIVQACRTRRVKFAEVAVALDCESCMQHRVHSEFSEPKRIAATVRFDTEETLATDVSDVAVSFRILSTDEMGSQLDVFTAQRAILSDVILALQSNGIDPVTVDPDVYCLSRYLLEYSSPEEAPEKSTLYATLSDSRGYLVTVPGSRDAAVTLRTFLIGSAQDRTAILTRETLLTAALVESAHPVGRLCVADTSGEIAIESLGERTGLPVATCDLTGLAAVEAGDIPDCRNAADFALAYGAALALPDKVDSVNLRNDHMPYLGKRMRTEKAVRFLSISLTILLLAVGVFFHAQLLKVNKYRSELQKKLEYDYQTVMLGETKFPATMQQAVTKLSNTRRILERNKTGQGDQESVSVRLTMVLQALNDCARQTDLNIDSITITGTSFIRIDGDTAGRRHTVEGVFPAMEKAGLKVLQNSVKTEGARDSFTMTVEPQKQLQGT